jgi:hypothetical protein
MAKSEDPQVLIQDEVEDVFALERTLEEMEKELAENELFRTFISKQKEAQAQIAATWKKVEQQMIEHDVKSIKGDWGSITIAERTNYKVVDMDALPNKFIKKVPDTTKIGQSHKLENKLPKGVETSVTKYLVKRIK